MHAKVHVLQSAARGARRTVCLSSGDIYLLRTASPLYEVKMTLVLIIYTHGIPDFWLLQTTFSMGLSIYLTSYLLSPSFFVFS